MDEIMSDLDVLRWRLSQLLKKVHTTRRALDTFEGQVVQGLRPEVTGMDMATAARARGAVRLLTRPVALAIGELDSIVAGAHHPGAADGE